MPKTPRESRELKGGIGIVATYFGELSAIDLCVLKNAWINRLHLHRCPEEKRDADDNALLAR